MLGDVNGQPVLDYGCGHGMAAAVLARAGAHVTAFDLSPGYVRETLERAEANGVHIQAVPADAHALPFADESFAAIWGNAVLHHLDLRQAAREIRRVLRPGGVAVFCEPWGGNPLLEFARKRLPYPGKARTPDEHPLTARDVATLREVFPNLTQHGQQLLAMAGRVAPRYLASANLHRADAWLLRNFPRLQAYTRYMVLVFRKPCDTLRND
jgi:ubiquinone/menaquinone biosynthesis C-methylase UbiE